MRRKIKQKTTVKPDPRYGSLKVAKLINRVMVAGKKNAARKVVYGALEIAKEKSNGENPADILETALKNASPVTEVRSRRIGGVNYQVPREVRPERRLALSIRWMVEAARNKKGSPMSERLSAEILAASKNEGEAIKKKENTHKMAEANKAFAHFSW